jgi:peptidoglycan/LPS O-acetylase OafA/YrhL
MGERQHLPFLDGWRGLAILAVLVGHFLTSGTALYSGRLGVELFFVLSGRLMAQILFVERTPLTVFYFRRASRILPALIALTVALLLAQQVLGNVPVTLWDAAMALTFTFNYAGAPNSALAHVWSLCIEEHAYLVLGLLAWVTRGNPSTAKPMLVAIALLCMANGALQTVLLERNYYDVYWHSDVRAASIFAGAALYLLAQHTHAPQSWVPLLSAGLGAALQFYKVPDPIKYSLGTALLAYGVATIEHAPLRLMRCLSSKALVLCGVWSYSLYLWQQPFYIAATGSHPINRCALLVAAAFCALVSFHLIEAPARAALNKRLKRNTGLAGNIALRERQIGRIQHRAKQN